MVHDLRKILLLAIVAFLLLVPDAVAREFTASSLRTNRLAYGGKRLRLGRFSFFPKLLFKNIVDDNALYADTGGITDYIIEVVPGLELVGTGRRFDVGLEYDFNFHKNVKQSLQDYLAHDLGSEIYVTPFGKRFFIRVEDNFERTSEPADIELFERMNIMSNEVSADLGYLTPGEDLEVSLGYINCYKHYSEIWDGSTFHGNGIELRSKVKLSSKYRFLPKTLATFDFNYTRTNQSFGQDFYGGEITSNGYRFMAGVVGAFTKKLSLVAKLGYTNIDYNIGADASELATQAGLNFTFTRKISFYFRYNRTVDYSVYSPYNKTNAYELKIKYQPSKKWRFTAALELYDIDFSGPVDNGAGQPREDFNIKFDIEGVYRIREWLAVIFGYSMQDRASNMVGFVGGAGTADFMRNTYFIAVGFNYY